MENHINRNNDMGLRESGTDDDEEPKNRNDWERQNGSGLVTYSNGLVTYSNITSIDETFFS